VDIGNAITISTGSVSIVNTPTITGTVTAIPSGTQVISGTVTGLPSGTQNVSIVSQPIGISGTASVNILSQPIGVSGTVTGLPSGTQTVLVAAQPIGVSGSVTPLGQPFAVFQTHIATQWNGFVTLTTSAAAGGILQTSGANTIYVTDVWLSVDVPMVVELRSATTAKAQFYLATKGGMVAQLRSPMVMNSAQSFTVRPLASGSMSAFAAGYTVT
jgi:hypothetical protein